MSLFGLLPLGSAIAFAAVAAALCAGLIVLLKPLLMRYALARPNARSSHTVPTPQGGGIAVIAATVVLSFVGIFAAGLNASSIGLVLAAAVLLAIVGAIDDLNPIDVLPRLLLQAAMVIAVIYALPADLRIVPAAPWWLERAVLVIAGLWFVNLTNFMDGLDWMTVAEAGPILAALTIIGLCGGLPTSATIVAAALGGALLGFAPFNRPVAKLFLGDVGSLPVGLLIGWLLAILASQHFAAALLLPLYYLADATITLVHRQLNGEKVWVAHRSHFYQRATTNGFSVLQVVGTIFALNVLLCALAATSILLRSPGADITLLALGAAAVGAVLWRFSRKRT